MNNLNELQHYLNKYGPDIETWPEAIKAKAITVSLSNSEFKAQLAEELNLYRMLQNRPIPPADTLAQQIIDAASLTPPASPNLPWISFEFWSARPVVSFASMSVVGFVLGIALSLTEPDLLSEDALFLQNYLYNTELSDYE